MNEAWKSSELWYQDFFTGFLNGKLAFALTDDESVKLGRMFADNVDEFVSLQIKSFLSLSVIFKSMSEIFHDRN